MKLYMLRRIAFSIFSLLVVVIVVMLLVYTLIPRNVIFQMDDLWNKKSLNDRTIYEYNQYSKFGYLTYVDFGSFLKKKYEPLVGPDYSKDNAFKADKDAIQHADSYMDNQSVQEFTQEYTAKGYKMVYLQPVTSKSGKPKSGGTGYYIAVQERHVFSRLWSYIARFFTVETTRDVRDPNLTERYIRIEKDPYGGPFAVVGSGTTHKYLLYFDGRWPFIHQNFIHMNLGVSFTRFRGQEITSVITSPTGDMQTVRTQFPLQLGTDEYADTAIDFHTLTYNENGLSSADAKQYPDAYTVASYKMGGLSMLENSFVIGIIATIIAYLLGLPLGVLMARHKDGIVDKIGNAYIIFIMAVPSLAYIFLFSAIGTRLFGLPYKFANAEVKLLAYILPVISLSLPSVGSLMKWMRRYMIDQMNSDYVKFARAEGLSEREIFSKHIARNAMIYIVHGIPGSILGCLVGAIITERVYSVPGVGNLLTVAINQHDNGIIVACTVFYTTLSIVSIILGDLLLAKYDPRISLTTSKGGGR